MKIKVRIPAMTVEVDTGEWSNEYGRGTSASDVREDVREYFHNTMTQDHTVSDGLVKFLDR